MGDADEFRNRFCAGADRVACGPEPRGPAYIVVLLSAGAWNASDRAHHRNGARIVT
jgi:hypothetical protein